jgi:hypothetical protein
MARNPEKHFNPGDRVAYAASFLRSTAQHTGEKPRMRGTVRSVEPFGPHSLVAIAWDSGPVVSHYHDDGLGRVISPNLTLVSRIAADSALVTA